MKTRLVQAGLWNPGEDELELNMTSAWRILARLGYPGRYAGKTQDGHYEYVIVNPRSGALLTSGKGTSLENAICEAAINALPLIEPGRNGLSG